MNSKLFITLLISVLITISAIYTISESGDNFQKDIDFFAKEKKTDSQKYNEDYLNNFMESIGIKDSKSYKEEQNEEELNSIVSDTIKFSSLKSKFKNYCLNGLDGKKLSEKEKLEAFVQGRCSPAVLLPGIMGSSLQVEIDCETLQKEEPEIFASCGWTRCENKWYQFSNGAFPKPEYQTWVPGIIKPNNGVTLTTNGLTGRGKCFGNIVQLRRQVNSKGEVEWKQPKGINMKVIGTSTETVEKANCGNKGITELAYDLPVNMASCALKGYKRLIQLLDVMGYQAGLTYQSMPYDFRYAIQYGSTIDVLEKTLKSLKYVTGKKSIIVSHSYGSQHTLEALNKFSQQFKDSHINQWIPTGGPISGAPKVIKLLLSKSDDFLVKSLGSIFGKEIMVGFQFYGQSKMAEATSATFDLLIKDTMSKPEIREQKWMQEILNRISYEKGEYTGKTPLDFFPSKYSTCRPNETGPNSKCSQNLVDFSEDFFVQIGNQKYSYTRKDIERMLEEHATPETLQQYIAQNQDVLETLPNPGVKVTNVYGNFLDVDYQYKYETSPLTDVLKGKFNFPSITKNTRGDGTVTSTSALLGPIKWKIEHDDKLYNSKPVRFVELCSSFNSTLNVNTERDSNGELTYTQSGYNGLECTCQKKENYEKCEHSCMIGDLNYVEFLANVFSSDAKSTYTYGTLIDETEIYSKMVKCENLM